MYNDRMESAQPPEGTDRMTVIAHWTCPEHPRQENAYYSMDDPPGWRCNVCGDALVKVEVVPAADYQGAVEAMYKIAEQAGLIDCDYALIARLLDEYGDGR